MNNFPRNAGYVMDEENDGPAPVNNQLFNALTLAQDQNMKMQQMVQQSQENVSNMRLAMVEQQGQMNSMKFVPVLAPLMASSGVFAGMPLDSMISASVLRSISADGSMREEVHFSFNPNERDRLTLEARIAAAEHERRMTELKFDHEIDKRLSGSVRSRFAGNPRERRG